MDENTLRQLAVEFKTAIEDARVNGEFNYRKWNGSFPKMLIYFPKGCCDIASELLAQYLYEKQKSTLILVHGEYEDTPHTWIETEDGYIIDITSGQLQLNVLFEEYYVPEVFTGLERSYYDCFIVTRRYLFQDWNNVKTDYSDNILKAYQSIIKYIEG